MNHTYSVIVLKRVIPKLPWIFRFFETRVAAFLKYFMAYWSITCLHTQRLCSLRSWETYILYFSLRNSWCAFPYWRTLISYSVNFFFFFALIDSLRTGMSFIRVILLVASVKHSLLYRYNFLFFLWKGGIISTSYWVVLRMKWDLRDKCPVVN